MPHVSKKRLDNDVLEKLSNQFLGVLKLVGRKDSTSIFIEELFTKTEKIMFAKRLAVVLLLHREMPQHVIADRLNMSPATIAKVSLEIEYGKYNGVLKLTRSKGGELAGVLIEILLDNLPPPFGRYRRRYQSIYRNSPRRK